MAETKDDLLADAQAIGVPDADAMTKPELQDAIAARTPVELGPPIPEGQSESEPPKAPGNPTTGVQPVEPDDIPEAGR